MSMDKNIIIVLIATRSIPLADGLDALLKAIPQIEDVQIARNLENAYQRIEAGKPQIALIDSVLLASNPEVALQKIRTLSPTTQRVLLSDDVQAVKWMPQYAEAILIKGALPYAVATIVTNLLLTQGEEHEHNGSNSKQDQSLP
jgi:DNA-binding NarL/FixJ family response regulator